MGRSKRRKFYGNRFSTSKEVTTPVTGTSTEVMLTCSEKKLQTSQEHFREDTVDKKEFTGFRIIDIEILIISFRIQELKLLHASVSVAENSMKHAAGEIRNADDPVPSVKCGVSVDGAWQRRGYSSLHGVVSAISILSGKVIDMEVMSQFCKKCDTKTSSSSFAQKHQCANHKGSSGNMEVISAYRIFERRSVNSRGLIYSEYFGHGDSKCYDEVKDIYRTNSVVKCECIGHVQKRVGTHSRNLKNKNKNLGKKGKLTDNFINKLQNYYGIVIRANVGNLLQMQGAVIPAFAHACSSGKTHCINSAQKEATFGANTSMQFLLVKTSRIPMQAFQKVLSTLLSLPT
ncbi:hypothetical protein AVEN_67313-1 [Araneus ventricosus]|uniref:Mutator-like transposase domain-containing protein n=1 Tax=Araneus ventricosus TaxID=182803 RepID=A0A4Y2LVE8_ARAVE|nr:hypothetical protein AVEN_67313-1 [Araneus ventricosus]